MSVNETETNPTGDAPLTRESSPFDPIDIRRDLIAMRTKHGADTPIGHRCSNIIRMLEYLPATGKNIQIQMAELRELTR